MRPLASLVLCLGLWSAVGPHGLQQLVEPPILSVKTDLVTLAVTVVDRTGAPVAGLRREHFTVYDNGEPQTIQFFTSEDVPATIGLIVDASASMRGRRNVLTSAADAFAAMRHPLDEFFALNFNEVVWPGLPPSVAFTDDTDQLRAALSTAPAQGMTALYDALDRALAHLQFGTRDRKALIVVSDGGDTASSQTLDIVVERARRTGAVIYSVMLFDPDDREARPQVLRKLARETGGHAFTPRRVEDVVRSFARVAREIRSGYTLGFTPADTSEGGFRSIRVVADAGDRRQLIARTRAGYYAGPTRRTGE
jgi:Ca-activated chloride channel family protein